MEFSKESKRTAALMCVLRVRAEWRVRKRTYTCRKTLIVMCIKYRYEVEYWNENELDEREKEHIQFWFWNAEWCLIGKESSKHFVFSSSAYTSRAIKYVPMFSRHHRMCTIRNLIN